jgi:hypothetical protein
MVNFAPRHQMPRIEYVEDILTIVHAHFFEVDMREALLNDPWFEKFVLNVSSWVAEDRPLTTEQARITIRILHKVKKTFVEMNLATEDEIQRLIARPRYRRAPTQSANIKREVRYLGDNLLGFRFKRNDLIMTELKNLKNAHGEHVAKWDWVARLWVVPVIRTTIQPLMEIIGDNRFGFDDDVAEYLALSTNSSGEPSTFVLDPQTGKLIATINDNEIVSTWIESSLKGRVL